MSPEPNITRSLRITLTNGQISELTETVKTEKNGGVYFHNYIFRIKENQSTNHPLDKLKYNLTVNRFGKEDEDKPGFSMSSEEITPDILHLKLKNIISDKNSGLEKISLEIGDKSIVKIRGEEEFDKLKYTLFSRLNFSLEDLYEKYKKIKVNISKNKDFSNIDSYSILSKIGDNRYICDVYEKSNEGEYKRIQYLSDNKGKISENSSSVLVKINHKEFYEAIKNHISEDNIKSLDQIELTDKSFGTQNFFKEKIPECAKDLNKLIDKNIINDLNKPKKTLKPVLKHINESAKEDEKLYTTYLIISYKNSDPEQIENIKRVTSFQDSPSSKKTYLCYEYKKNPENLALYRYDSDKNGKAISEREKINDIDETMEDILKFLKEQGVSHIIHNKPKAAKTELTELLTVLANNHAKYLN